MGCPEGKGRLLHRALMLERCSFPAPFVVKCQRQNGPCAKHFPKCVHGTVRIIFHRNWYIFRENKVSSVGPEGTKGGRGKTPYSLWKDMMCQFTRSISSVSNYRQMKQVIYLNFFTLRGYFSYAGSAKSTWRK